MIQHEDFRIPSGCGVAGIIDEAGGMIGGDMIIKCMEVMHERSNGLGAGFAAYGLFPEHREDYCLQVMFDGMDAKREAESVLKKDLKIIDEGPIPTRRVDEITNRPVLWRYFARTRPGAMEWHYDMTEDDVVVKRVMEVNEKVGGAFVMSSGKNMAVFKGVGFPETIAEFYKIDEYNAYMWTGHGRFPTNTPGWWGGAHPFCLLDCSVVHNGEISSYGTNKRCVESLGYKCMLQTDSEAILYIFDLLLRRERLPLEIACMAVAPPFWDEIDEKPEDEAKLLRAIRLTYGGLMLNGPASFILAFRGTMVGLNDRIKLRPLVAARKGDRLYMASEECGIRAVCEDPDTLWMPDAGRPVVGRLKEGLQ